MDREQFMRFFAPDKKFVYRRHAEKCKECNAVDVRKAGARRCNVGFKALLDAGVDSPTALASPV